MIAYLLVAASILGLGSCLSCADDAPLALQHDKSGNLFYFCRNGKASIIACDPGFQYNHDTKSCMSIEVLSRVPNCPLDQNVTIYLPHEEACDKFYTCYQGHLEEITCPEGLEFNPDANVCDWPKPGGCGITTPFYNTTTEMPSTNTTDSLSTPDSNSTATEGPSNSTTTESPFNSTTTEGPSNSTTSSPPTNSTTEIPSNSTTTEDPSNSTTTENPSNSTTSSPPINSTSSGSFRVPVCPANQTETIYYPHELYCDKFYYCILGSIFEATCPSGLEFNPEANVCDWPKPGGCGINNTITTEMPDTNTTDTQSTPSSNSTTEGPSNSTTLSPPTNSTTESPSNSTTTEGPSNSTTSSPPTNSTESPSNSTTLSPPTTICPFNETTISIIPHETSCQKFYVCFAGIPTEYTCDDGQEFDPILANCVNITSEGCTASQLTTVTPAPPEQGTDEPQHEICKPNDNNITIIAHETDCHKFYVCFMGVATELSCDAELNLEFDPVQKVCVTITGNGCTASKPTAVANFFSYFKLF